MQTSTFRTFFRLVWTKRKENDNNNNNKHNNNNSRFTIYFEQNTIRKSEERRYLESYKEKLEIFDKYLSLFL